jgi:hypothetical protein
MKFINISWTFYSSRHVLFTAFQVLANQIFSNNHVNREIGRTPRVAHIQPAESRT